MLLAGAVFAALLGYLLARRMVGPIRLLEEGAERIGAGRFDHKIAISTGDAPLQASSNGNEGAVAIVSAQNVRKLSVTP